LSDYTFKPTLLTKRQGPKCEGKIEDTLIEYGKHALEKREKMKQHYESQELYTHKPEISKRSERIVLDRSRLTEHTRSDRFGELYHDAIERKERLGKAGEVNLDRECTFKPQMVAHFKDVKKRAPSPDLEKSKQTRDENVDPSTGKPYFHPTTGRSPKGRAAFSKEQIGNYLY